MREKSKYFLDQMQQSNSEDRAVLMDKAIETFKLTKKFNRLIAVDKININIEKGEVFGLLGPNGAGKTTTISMLCTILKPTSGTAKVNGFDIVSQATQVRKSIGIVFQDPSVDDRLTARENLYMHANLYDVPQSEQKSRIDKVLKLVELEDRADDILRTYSSGMRRRLEIARGLTHYPHILFLDEPTIGLDPQTREHIWEYIEELKKAHDITIVLTTHYMDEADRLSDRVAIIDYGKIVTLDTPANLKETLEGDLITVKTQNAEELQSIVSAKITVQKSYVINKTVEFTVRDGKTLMPRIVEIATQNNIYIDSISLREPNLQDVFLHYTGRAIRVDDGGELHGMSAIRRRAIR
jgi:ABC-2 type transport system ATP-binding protein